METQRAGAGGRHDTAPRPCPLPRPQTPSLPKTHPMTPEVGGLPTMHATPCATLVGKGHTEAEAQREKQQQGLFRERSAGREGECQRRGAGQGCGGSWAVFDVGAPLTPTFLCRCLTTPLYLDACWYPTFPQTMLLPLSFLVPQQIAPGHVMPLSLNTTSLYGANPDTCLW